MKAEDRKYHPPKFAQWLLSKFLTEYSESAILGDLEEEYNLILREKGKIKADIYYWKYLIKNVPKALLHYLYWGGTMFRSYLKIAFRNIFRNKGYSLINVLGLAIGMACAILIYLYVSFEMSYDNYHSDLDRLYRVCSRSVSAQETSASDHTSGPIGPSLKETFPQVEAYTRILPLSNGLIKHEDKMFYEERVFGDSQLFDIFTLPFIRGSKEGVPDKPYTCVITDGIATKFFGNENPVGKLLLINTREYEVAGVIADQPLNSHYKFKIIMSISAIKEGYPWEQWFLCNFNTYIKLKPNTSIPDFESKISDIYNIYIPDQIAGLEEKQSLFLQRIDDIHLDQTVREARETSGNPFALRVLWLTGIFILLIACINFINLTTARSSKRAKEVGLRKVIGGFRKQLVWQFMGEAFLMCAAAIVISFVLVYYGLVLIRIYGGVDLSINYLFGINTLLSIVGLLLFVTAIAGGYPSIVLSSFKPADVLKSGSNRSGGKSSLRRALVILQFSASAMLIISTLIVFNQVTFMKNMNLGFDKEHKLVIPLNGPVSISKNYETVKNEFKTDAAVKSVTCASHTPGEFGMNYFDTELPTESGIVTKPVHFFSVDGDYINDLGIKLLAGRNFLVNSLNDEKESLILNRAAVNEFGIASPEDMIGRRMVGIFDTASVVGVVEDFHYWGLQEKIEPAILVINPGYFKRIILTVEGNPSEVLTFAENKFKELFPGNPFEYYFLDEQFNKLYKEEEQFGNLFGWFASIGLFIACIGLIGLASFTAQQKTKEIGIRKVLGSSIKEIIILLSKDFTKWIIIGNLVACPFAYYGMTKWMEDFAYQSGISIVPFVIALVVTLIFALVAVSYQSIKAARSNPVEALKYE